MTRKELVKLIRKLTHCSKKRAKKLAKRIQFVLSYREPGDISPAAEAYRTVRELKRSNPREYYAGIFNTQFYAMPKDAAESINDAK